ncbi:YncE family protein [Burkholderia sp. Tr-862]|uniref:YncE family protein n=1 Tax=Burkholderia sp. Tr-862 TaxID=2608331 RepID=UPI00141A20F4|nr:YncE family protein [Burkholderia sp. Tr-862]NIF40387.1 YncE family protein [Burkholderia sp. Tr-862]
MKTRRPGRVNRAVGNYLVILVLSAIAGAFVPAIAQTAAQEGKDRLPLTHVVDIPLPGRPTRLDYESYDPARHLLFIAHLGDGEVIVVDMNASRAVARVPGISSVHGVLAIPELSRVYASATGTNEIVAVDEATLKVVARIPGGRYPDGIAYAPDMHKIYVSDETGNTETVIDVQSNRRVATIPLGGEVGNTQYDPASRHIFVNVQTRNEPVEIDPTVDRIVRRFALPGADRNHGLLIDSSDGLAFIACQGNDKLLVFDMAARQVVQAFGIGKDPDVLAFDPALNRLYVAAESGVVSVFGINRSKVSLIGEGWVGSDAHAVAVDHDTHRSYFPLKNLDGRPVLRVMAPR